MPNKYEERLGTEPIVKLTFKMAMPAIAAQLVNLLYNIVDRIFIGHIPDIGTDALAGVGITSAIIILISAFSSIVGGGGAPLASIALGQGDRKKASQILGNGFVMLAIFTVVVSAVTWILMEPILRFSGASDNTLPYAAEYLNLYLVGTFFVMISTGLNNFINAQGRPGMAMWPIILGAALNLILDPIFIFVLDMGVKGAALATIISQAASAIFILKFLVSENASLKLSRAHMHLNSVIVKSITGLGLSPFIMASTESLVGFVLNSGLREFGDIYVSSLAIMMSAMQIVSVPLNGFAQGFVPIVSYNYGHGLIDRVRGMSKLALSFMFAFNFALILIMIIFPGAIASIFTKDTLLIETVCKHMPLFLAGMTIFGLQRACQNMFVALGQAKVSIFIALLRKVFLLVPLALILPKFFGVSGIFGAEALADATAAIICTAIFLHSFPKILKQITRKS